MLHLHRVVKVADSDLAGWLENHLAGHSSCWVLHKFAKIENISREIPRYDTLQTRCILLKTTSMTNLSVCQALHDLVFQIMLFILCFFADRKNYRFLHLGRSGFWKKGSSSAFAACFDIRHSVTATIKVTHNSSLLHLVFIIPAGSAASSFILLSNVAPVCFFHDCRVISSARKTVWLQM